MACAETHDMSHQSRSPGAAASCRRRRPASGLSISPLAINNVEHRHDKPRDSEVVLDTHRRTRDGRLGARTRTHRHTHTHRNITCIHRQGHENREKNSYMMTYIDVFSNAYHTHTHTRTETSHTHTHVQKHHTHTHTRTETSHHTHTLH